MAIVIVYKVDESVYGEINTDKFLYKNLPTPPAGEKGTFTLDANIYPFVKIDGKYFVNSGERWEYDDGNKTASLMPKANAYTWWVGNQKTSLSDVPHEFVNLTSSNAMEKLSDPFYTPWTNIHATIFKTKDYQLSGKSIKGWCSEYNFPIKKEGNFIFSKPNRYGWEETGEAYKFGFSDETYPIVLYSNFNKLESEDKKTHILKISPNYVEIDGIKHIKRTNDKVVLYYRKPKEITMETWITENMDWASGSYDTFDIVSGAVNWCFKTSTGSDRHYTINILGDQTTTYATGTITCNNIEFVELNNGKTYEISNTKDPSTLSVVNISDNLKNKYSSIIKTHSECECEVNALKNVTDHYQTGGLGLFKSVDAFISDYTNNEKALTHGFACKITVNNYQTLLGEEKLSFESDNVKREGQDKKLSGDVECYVSDGDETANLHLKLVGKIDCFNGVLSNWNIPMISNYNAQTGEKTSLYKKEYPTGKNGYPAMKTYEDSTTIDFGYYKKLQSETYGIAIVLWRSVTTPYGDAKISEKSYNFSSDIKTGVVKTISWDTDIDAKELDDFNVVNIPETGWTANIKSYSVTKTSSNKWKVTVVLEWNGGGPTYSSGTLRFECRHLEN